MFDFLSKLFDTSDFPARWNCGTWTVGHGWLHILSDLGVWSAYVAIPCVLGYFVVRRKDIPFRTIFLLFGAFILACGTTHLMEVLMFWWPAYRLAGVVKLFTAVVSWGTVLALVPVTPKALAMRSPEELEREIAARKNTENALQKANAELERQVAALQASEERFRLLVDGTKEYAIFMLDPTGRIVSWNPGAERIKQYPASQIIGQHMSRFYPPEDVRSGKPQQQLQVAAAEGKYEDESWRVRKDGSRFWASVVITALRDELGELRGFGKVTRDVTERKLAEENARRLLQEEAARRAAEEHAQVIERQREQLRVTLTSIGDGVITTDAEGRVTLLNPVAETLTGWTTQDASGQPLMAVFRIVNENTRQPVENPVGRVLREGTIVGLANHTALLSKDGTVRPIEDSAAPIRGEHGQIIGVVLVFRDSTERRATEAAVHRHQEILQLVHRIGKIGHWEWNSATDENKWSPEIEALYGLRPGTFGGTYDAWAKLLHPDDLPKQAEVVRRALETGKYFTEFRVIWPEDGSVHWLEARANVFKDGQDKPVRIMGVNMDVTERKRTEERLRLLWEAAAVMLSSAEPDAMLRELFANIGPHFGLDTYFNYLANETGDALRLVSYIGIPDEAAKQITRLEFGQAICGTVAVQRQPIVATHIQQSDDPKAEFVKSFGIRAYVCHPLQVNKNLLGTLSFASRSRDQLEPDALEFLQTICQYVAVAYERLRLVRELRQADRKKDEFLATLAHELRNPLAPLRNALELLRRSEADDDVSEQARSMMGRQLDQMVRLIDDLLDMSRISQGKVQLRKERVELKAVVHSAVEAVQPLIQAQAHELTVTLPSQPIYLDADATRLAQVISNLLNNAAKYTEKSGHIWLSAEPQRNAAVISVRDTGIGIAAEHLPHVFEMFSQVAPALERSQGGLGIGLSLVRRLVEMHGGTVEAQSGGIGKGSEFIVRLSVVETQVQPGERAAQGEKHQSGPKRRILVVDDNRDAADSMAMMLSMTGHETRTAYDGLEAVQAAAGFQPDVVLLDIGLPKMNGYEAARHIRQQTWGKGMALFALTGWGQEEDKRRALEAGFDHHLTKPVEATFLEKLLARMNPLPRD
jgi:PAS domain S-box-containing protein